MNNLVKVYPTLQEAQAKIDDVNAYCITNRKFEGITINYANPIPIKSGFAVPVLDDFESQFEKLDLIFLTDDMKIDIADLDGDGIVTEEEQTSWLAKIANKLNPLNWF